MTRQEAIKEIEDVIATIRSYINQVESIKGSEKDRECNSFIGNCNRYISIYKREIEIYESVTDERFSQFHPTSYFRTANMNLMSLEVACRTIVSKGPRFNPNPANIIKPD